MTTSVRPHFHTLSFRNSFQLFLEANLDEFFRALERGPADRFIAERLRKWRLHNVEQIYLMVPAGMEPDRMSASPTREGDHFLELERIFQRNGIQVFLTPLAALAGGDFRFQTKLNQEITRGLKQHPTSIVCLEDSRAEVEISLATLMLRPDGGLSPEKALLHIRGRSTVVGPADRRVFEYKKHLDPQYNLPPFAAQPDSMTAGNGSQSGSNGKGSPAPSVPPESGPRLHLQFKNSKRLLLESDLGEFLNEEDPRNERISRRLRKWRVHEVDSVFIMVPAGMEPDRENPGANPAGQRFLELESALQGAGLRVFLTPLAALSTNEFGFQKFFNKTLIEGLKQEPAAVFFQEDSREQVEGALATLLLTPTNGMSPQAAWRFVSGRDDARIDPRLLSFKKHLDPDFEFPTPDENAPAPVNGPATPRTGPPPAATGSKTEPDPGPPKTKEAEATETITHDAITEPAKPGAATEPVSDPVEPAKEDTTSSAPEKSPAPPATATATAPDPVAAKKPAKEPAEAKTDSDGEVTGPIIEADPGFTTGSLSIKVKMVGIISGIILLAMSSMAVLATYFFSQDSTTRIEENILALTEVIGARVESEFENLSYKGLLLATNLMESDAAQQKIFTDLFFRKNTNIIFVGVAENQGGSLNFIREQFNETFLAEKQIEPDEVRGLHTLGTEAFMGAFAGGEVVRNVSPGFPEPVVGLALPFNEKRIVVLYLFLDANKETGRFLRSFAKETTGIATAYLVDSQSKVIAHPILEEVKAGSNYENVPIVDHAIQNTNPNGLRPYTFTVKNEDGEDEEKEFLGSFSKLNFASLAVISFVDKKEALKAVDKIRDRNLIITGIVVLASVLIVFFFARTISVPILRLVDATRQVESGDYAVTISPAARDEVGELTNSFVQMASGLAERERVKDALGKFVNKEIAELASAGEIHLGGERKEAAVFFSDLRGFTAMSEGRTPEEIVSILNEYFTAMVATIEETHGVVDKFIGDAIMAHWGAVKTVGNNTENAINAGLLMRKALVALNERNTNLEGSPFLKMGSGINTGPVISGQIGSDNRFEFTVIGDAVNLASRIEALNKPFGTDLLISQDSYDLVKDIFNVEPMPAIKVKGKAEPQTIYAILGRKDDPDCPKNMGEVREMLGIEYDADKAGGGDEKEVKYEILEKK